MKIVQFLACVCLGLLNSIPLAAQAYNFKIDVLYNKNYVQTPEMSAIKQIALSSVNYSTGCMDIRIPLLDIECGDLKLPIYLSYNSSGIKVNEPCSWVGQNWSLHAEPMVTRIPRGHVDDAGTCNYDFFKNKTTYTSIKQYLDYSAPSSDDFMPDEYNYSLLTGGGMFMYCQDKNKQNKYVCLPYDDMYVDWIDKTITDPLGVQYVFRGGVDRIKGKLYVDSWHASSVIAPNGVDKILFKYDNLSTVSIKRHEDYITVVDNCQLHNTQGYHGGFRNYSEIMSYTIENTAPPGQQSLLEQFPDVEELFRMPVIYQTFDDVTKSYQLGNMHNLVDDGRVIDRLSYYNKSVDYEYQHLSEISFLGNKVTFKMNEGKCLTDIIVTNSEGRKIKHFQLTYEQHRERHYLMLVKELATDGSVAYTYKLNYNNTGDVTVPGGRAYDFWGYSNSSGITDVTSLVPIMKLYVIRSEPKGDYTIGVVDSLIAGGDFSSLVKKVRHADEKYMQCGMLSSIEHPTGVKECFVWEANKARLETRISLDESNVFHIGDELDGKNGIYVLGGLRIKELNVVDSGKTRLRRTFVYGEKEDGVGTTPLRNGINYFLRTQTKVYDDIGARSGLGYSTSRYRTLSSSPVVPITYYNGASTMYSKVTEYTYQEDKPVYKTVYKYTLPNWGGFDMLSQEDMWDFHIHNYANWYSDHLDSKAVYGATDDGFKLVSMDSYGYNRATTPKKDYTIRGREYRCNYHENFPANDVFLIPTNVYIDYKDYQVTPKAKLLVSQSHTEYMPNGTKMSTLQTYGYGNSTDIRMTSQTVTRGSNKYTVHTTYPSNINTGDYSEMVKKNMLDYPVEEYMERNGKVISARLMTYSSQDGGIQPNKIYAYTPGEASCPIAHFVKFDGENVNGLYTPLQELSFAKGRINSLVDQQNIVTSYKWDANRQYPIQERKVGGGQEMVRTFSYLSGVGMTSETKPTGDVVSYVYDTSGRLSTMKDLNGKTLQKYRYKYVSGKESHGEVTPLKPVETFKIKLSYTKNAMPFSMSYKLSASVFPVMSGIKISWCSSDIKVAKVTSDGVVTIVGGGVCDIIATASGSQALCRITANAKTGYYQITPIVLPDIRFMDE